MDTLRKTTTKAPVLLDRLANLTAIRNVEVYECSLLKTLAELLQIPEVCLYKLDDERRNCQLLCYRHTGDAAAGGGVAPCDVKIATLSLPDDIAAAQRWLATHSAPYRVPGEQGYALVYPVQGPRGVSEYIKVQIGRPMSASDHLIIESLLRISKNFHSLLEENQIDQLTGLLNRKTFDDSVEKIQSLLFDETQLNHYTGEEHRRNDSPRQPLWLAIMDIDHFKRINDTYGHVFGDEVLLRIAQLMRANFRSKDLLFRFGGEEFVIILQAPDKTAAHGVLGRFLHEVANHRFPQIDRVTVSIGVTGIASPRDIISELVGRADRALYYAKHNGRNRLDDYQDLVAKGILLDHIQTGSIDLF